jgi:hypothetical protein
MTCSSMARRSASICVSPGPPTKPKPPALAFKVGPGAHKPGALVGQGRQFHLQHTFAGAGAVGEDLEDQAGPVQQLDAPFLFQIALLHGADGAVDQHQFDIHALEAGLQFLDLAGAEKGARQHARQAHNLGPGDREARQCGGQRHRFGQPVFGQAAAHAPALQVRVQDIGDRRACPAILVILRHREDVILSGFIMIGDQSSPS